MEENKEEVIAEEVVESKTKVEELETKEVCVGYTNIYRKSTIQ